MKHSRFTCAALLAVSLFFSSCLTVDKVPQEMTAAELLREAQNAYDKGSSKKALIYYEALSERYGSDVTAYITARYETAHIYIKKKKWAKAEPILQEVIEIYRNMPAGTISSSFLKLAETDLAKIPQAKQTQQTESISQ